MNWKGNPLDATDSLFKVVYRLLPCDNAAQPQSLEAGRQGASVPASSRHTPGTSAATQEQGTDK